MFTKLLSLFTGRHTAQSYYNLLFKTSSEMKFQKAQICKYRFDGGACPIGLLIPDNKYSPNIEMKGVENPDVSDKVVMPYGMRLRDLYYIQLIHDQIAMEPGCWWGDLSHNKFIHRLNCEIPAFFHVKQKRLPKVNLWIDDIRSPCQDYDIWARTYHEAISVLKHENVTYVSFDHDLGTDKTGYDIAKWVEEQAYRKFIKRFNWGVHSQNSEGSHHIFVAMTQAEKYWSET